MMTLVVRSRFSPRIGRSQPPFLPNVLEIGSGAVPWNEGRLAPSDDVPGIEPARWLLDANIENVPAPLTQETENLADRDAVHLHPRPAMANGAIRVDHGIRENLSHDPPGP